MVFGTIVEYFGSSLVSLFLVFILLRFYMSELHPHHPGDVVAF